MLVSTQRLRELRATAAKEIEGPGPVEIEVRDVTAPELKQLGDERAE